MRKCLTIIILILILFLSSCHDPEYRSFRAPSDCFVYKSEIKTERCLLGRVEFIDTSKASGCTKQQLKDVYVLHYDTICIVVYNQHPKDNIEAIQYFAKKYQTDSTRLYSFTCLDSSVNITVERLCKDKDDAIHNGEYVWWKNVEFSTISSPYQKTKEEILNTWYKWEE